MFIGTCSKETKEEIQHTYIKEVPLIWSDLIDFKWFRGLFRTIGRSFGTLTVSRHFDMFTGSEILFKYKVIYHFIRVIFQMGQSAKIHFSMLCGTRSFQTGNVKWQPHSLLSPSPNSLLINLSTFLMFYILLSSSPISPPWWCCSSTWRPETVILRFPWATDQPQEPPSSGTKIKPYRDTNIIQREANIWWCNDQMNTYCYLGMNATCQKYVFWPGAFSWFSFSSDMLLVEVTNFQRCRELQTIRN